MQAVQLQVMMILLAIVVIHSIRSKRINVNLTVLPKEISTVFLAVLLAQALSNVIIVHKDII